MPGSKTCSLCRVDQPLGQFHKGSAAHGRHSHCKTCFNTAKRGKKATPDQRRKWNFSRRYGLAPEAVAAMVASQGGTCAICRLPMKRACVDHDHATGKVRGVLCHGCNIKLPAVEDRAYLEAAQRYLGLM